MLEKNVLNKIKKHTNLLLAVSITSLILINFLPWIMVSEQTGNEKIFFNYEAMTKNDNFEIIELTGIINNIILITWTIIILGLICFIGLTLYLSKQAQLLSLLMIGSGSIIFIMEIAVAYLSFKFIQNVAEVETVSLAYVFGPFSYSFLIFVSILLSLLISFVISTDIFSFFKAYHKNLRSKKKKKIPFEYPKPQSSLENNKKMFSNNMIRTSKAESEDWSKNNNQVITKENEDIIQVEKKEELYKEKKNIELNELKEKKVDTTPGETLSSSKNGEDLTKKEEDASYTLEKKERVEDNKLKFDHTFEQVLFSAIEKKKKQKEIGKKDLEQSFEKQNKDVGEIKKFKVRCLKCKNEFIAEIRAGDKKIKCPICGEEGEL